jgi:3-hydroxyisobutyrate dehydrogenase-like beta-hydroxyacid dehydrogenase
MSLPAIGFVGVGRMGANMARRLKEVGYPIVAVYDARPEAAADVAAELEATAAERVSEVSRLAEVTFTIVTDDAAMRSIYFGPNNLFEHASGKLFVNCATVNPAVHVEVEAAGVQRGAQVLEAPMASSISQAREGTLYMMLAGDQGAYRRAEPILEQLTSARHYTGKPGSAAALKALINMVMNINTAGLAEGLGLAEALGLDLKLVKEVFSQTGANSRVLETDGQDMIDREHSVFFSAAHAAKDSGIALELAKIESLHLPLLEASKRQFDRMVELGLGEIDKSGISELTFRSRRASG